MRHTLSRGAALLAASRVHTCAQAQRTCWLVHHRSGTERHCVTTDRRILKHACVHVGCMHAHGHVGHGTDSISGSGSSSSIPQQLCCPPEPLARAAACPPCCQPGSTQKSGRSCRQACGRASGPALMCLPPGAPSCHKQPAAVAAVKDRLAREGWMAIRKVHRKKVRQGSPSCHKQPAAVKARAAREGWVVHWKARRKTVRQGRCSSGKRR